MTFVKGHDDPVYPVKSCFTQIFEWRTKNTLFVTIFSLRLHRIPWVFHVQRNPWIFQVFQVCGVWPSWGINPGWHWSEFHCFNYLATAAWLLQVAELYDNNDTHCKICVDVVSNIKDSVRTPACQTHEVSDVTLTTSSMHMISQEYVQSASA